MWLPSPVSRLAVSVAAGALACPILFRLLQVFSREDSYRLKELAGRTPQWLRSASIRCFDLSVRSEQR